MILRLILTFSLLLVVRFSYGQLVVTNTATPDSLVNSVLLGNGITAMNLTFNGSSGSNANKQLGYFANGSGSIGLSSGIILATGGTSVAIGPNDIPSATVAIPDGTEIISEPDLQQIIGPVAIHDVAMMEFDFQAEGDTLRFRFVFASEEYNEYTCSPYNDAFGFFISGPGITGNPNYQNNALNIARIPGTNVPVGINTVNQGFPGAFGANSVCNAVSSGWQNNQIYFVNNAENTDPTTTQFDGFTKPLLIEIPVVCGGIYHIKLAIADAVDRNNDSAVFIEAGSFSSEVPLEVAVYIDQPDIDEPALEGCSVFELKLSRSDSTRVKTVYLRTIGLANQNAVMPDLPESIEFAVGERNKTLLIETQNDFVFSGDQNFTFEFLQPAVCDLDTVIISIPFFITDRMAMVVDFPTSVWLACDENGTINILPEGGNPPYQITWNQTGLSGFQPDLSNQANNLISATITDFCGLNQVAIETMVEREEYPPMIISLTDSIQFNCLTPVLVQPEISGGSGDCLYSWQLNGMEISNQLALNEIITSPGTIVFNVVDRCAGLKSAEIEAVPEVNPMGVSLGNDTTALCTEMMSLSPVIQGGFGGNSFLWYRNNNQVSSDPVFTFIPESTSSIKVEVTDVCGQKASDTLFVYVDKPELIVNLPADTVICKGDILYLEPSVSGGFGDYTFFWPSTGSTAGAISTQPDANQAIECEVTDACSTKSTVLITVDVQEVVASFHFDYENEFSLLQNLSSPDCIYEWILPDGSISNLFQPIFEPQSGQEHTVFLSVQNEYGCEATSVEFYDPPLRIFIPTAFTPDGDGLNDIFKAEGQFVGSFHLMIFERGGRLVFESHDISRGWRGDNISQEDFSVGNGIYAYRYVAKSITGAVLEGKGQVLMIR